MASYFDSGTETPTFESLAKLAENLVYRLPGCSDLMVLKTLRDVYRDFVRRSCCLRTTRRILLEDGVSKYPVLPVYGQRIDRVVNVEMYGWRHPLLEGRDFSVTDTVPPCVALRRRLPASSASCAYMLVTADESPDLESDRAPEWFLQKHGDDICNGAMAKLTIMANKPWSDPQAAVQYRLFYENAVGAAYLSVMCGGDHGTPDNDNPLASELL